MIEATFAAWAVQAGDGQVTATVAYRDPFTNTSTTITGFGAESDFQEGQLVVRESTTPPESAATVFADAFHTFFPSDSDHSNRVIRFPQISTVRVPGDAPVDPRDFFPPLFMLELAEQSDPYNVAVQALTSDKRVLRGTAQASSGADLADRIIIEIPEADRDGLLLTDGRRYLPRTIAGQPDYLVLRKLRGYMNIRLKGVAGGGKTTLPEVAFGEDLITVQGHGDLSVSSLIGHYQPQPDGTFLWCDGPLLRAMKCGKVLLIDEINRAPSETIAILLSVADARTQLVIDDRPDLPTVHAAPGFSLVITYNEEGRGIRPLDNAIKRRFPFEVTVETDYDVAESAGIDSRLIKVGWNLLTQHDESIATGGRPIWRPQMADLIAAQKLLDAGLGDEFAAATLVAACPDPDVSTLVATAVSTSFAIPNVRPLQLGGAA